MKFLLDTHLLLWTVAGSDRLPEAARTAIREPANEPFFSAASLWEIAIKRGLGRVDFRVDTLVLRRTMLENGYIELPITGAHAVAAGKLPPIHRDPFDRMLVAQAIIEGIPLMTSDPEVAQYPGPIQKV